MQFIHSCVSHDNPQQYRILRQKLLVVRGMVQIPIAKKEDVETPPLKVSFPDLKCDYCDDFTSPGVGLISQNLNLNY